MGVLETTFYQYVGYARDGRQIQMHINSGLLKPQEHNVQANATLRCIFNRSTDHMLYRTRILPLDENVVLKVLLVMWEWKESNPEINMVDSAFGLKDVSLANLSMIQKLNFSKYETKKPGDNFAHCLTYDRLYFVRKAAILGVTSGNALGAKAEDSFRWCLGTLQVILY